jgi:Transposase and inactivated derivatives
MQNDLQEILTQAVASVKSQYGKVILSKIAELTPFTERQLRRLRDNGFVIKANGNAGKKKSQTKLSQFMKTINEDYLKKGITNASLVYERIQAEGYRGGLTTVKNYMRKHSNLVPAQRVLAIPTPNRGRRYVTAPGEMFQMDWGFVKILDNYGNEWQCACFCMVCHHCGFRYAEFFPSAKQDNLFIAMIHAFVSMGVPQVVLTDNMKSVVIKRLADGTPVWNKDYEAFQLALGFKTRLAKVAHPFTKGKVERLVRYIKDNFIVGRTFINLTEINRAAREWCYAKNCQETRGTGIVPIDTHHDREKFGKLPTDDILFPFLAPIRKISYDGFVCYEGRAYGVPLLYSGKYVRVERKKEVLCIYDPDSLELLVTHRVDWSRTAKCCEGQWKMPEEQPTMPVTVSLRLTDPPTNERFKRFSLYSCKEANE